MIQRRGLVQFEHDLQGYISPWNDGRCVVNQTHCKDTSILLSTSLRLSLQRFVLSARLLCSYLGQKLIWSVLLNLQFHWSAFISRCELSIVMIKPCTNNIVKYIVGCKPIWSWWAIFYSSLSLENELIASHLCWSVLLSTGFCAKEDWALTAVFQNVSHSCCHFIPVSIWFVRIERPPNSFLLVWCSTMSDSEVCLQMTQLHLRSLYKILRTSFQHSMSLNIDMDVIGTGKFWGPATLQNSSISFLRSIVNAQGNPCKRNSTSWPARLNFSTKSVSFQTCENLRCLDFACRCPELWKLVAAGALFDNGLGIKSGISLFLCNSFLGVCSVFLWSNHWRITL